MENINNKVSLTIDEKEILADPGQTILEAAKENNPDIRLRIRAQRMINLSKDRLEEAAAENAASGDVESAT